MSSGVEVRTTVSEKTGVTYQLCCWNHCCQMPVTTTLGNYDTYCRWHRRCLTFPEQAANFEIFAMYLQGMQQAYPSTGWWGWSAEQLWPVLQGVQTIWAAEAVSA